MSAFRQVVIRKQSLEKLMPLIAQRQIINSCAAKIVGVYSNSGYGPQRQAPSPKIIFSPSSLMLSPSLERIAPGILPKPSSGLPFNLELPNLPVRANLEMPTTKASLDKIHIIPEAVKIEAPQAGQIIEKRAARMVKIRYKKMKKHQRRKFRKKFIVQIRKVKQRRLVAKETIFLSALYDEMKLAESFDAKEYAAQKRAKANAPKKEKQKVVIPQPWQFVAEPSKFKPK